VEGRDMGGLVAELHGRIDREIALPPGYSVVFGGQFENQQRAQARLMVVVPLSLGLIFLLLYFNFRNVMAPAVVMLSVPFALIGGFWLVYWSGFNISVAVAVGFIALAGVAVETGILVLTFIEETVSRHRQEQADAFRRGESKHERLSAEQILEAIHEGTSKRVRPVAMTASSTIIGLLPIMLGGGTGSDVMQRIAAPMVGGMITTTFLCLLVLPVIYAFVLQWREKLPTTP